MGSPRDAALVIAALEDGQQVAAFIAIIQGGAAPEGRAAGSSCNGAMTHPFPNDDLAVTGPRRWPDPDLYQGWS
jgi:hypothetical protein